ncbi:FAD-dependent monooxygenase [Bradyrhizobium erythrophlei]|uniref:FAD-dependent monooxygenase n=1 Tax=Bradyrhizobium erythrophlei TaxID=1437360 RepID=UPI003CC7F1F5
MFCVTYIETDVLIVGAGPAGLTATALLARLGVKSISVTKYDSTADSPRAHITNQRSMEIFRDLGFEDRVRARAMPQDLMGTQVFATSFAGLELARTREVGEPASIVGATTNVRARPACATYLSTYSSRLYWRPRDLTGSSSASGMSCSS